MTPEQRAALDVLPPKRRTFVLEYLRTGNATEAARRAGYAKAKQEGARLLTFAAVRRALEVFQKPAEEHAYRNVEGLRAWWAQMMDNEDVGAKERLKASELLAKSQGAFIERHEVDVRGGAVLGVVAFADPAEAVKTARALQAQRDREKPLRLVSNGGTDGT